MRSNHCPRGISHSKGLLRKNATDSRFRCYPKQTTGIYNQQLHASPIDDSPALPVPLADRTLFQMDQTASSNQSFYGTTENAVKTQIWIAITIYVLVAIVKKQLKLDQSLYTILQILSVALFEKTPFLGS